MRRLNIYRYFLAAACAAVPLASCKPSAASVSASAVVPAVAVKSSVHTAPTATVAKENSPARDGSWRWQAVSDTEWFEVAAPYATLPGRDETLVPGAAPRAAHHLATRLEQHLKTLEAVDDRLVEGVKTLPPLRVVLVRDPEANAYVGPVPVCIDVAVEFADGPVNGDEVELVAMTPDGFVTAYPDDACIKRKVSAAMLEDMAARMTAGFPGCVVSVRSDAAKRQSLSVSGTCPQDAALDGAVRASRLVFDATADRLVITTGLIRALSESEWLILPTLAHELAHYRMAHVTRRTGESEYYFQVPGGRGRDPTVTSRGKRASQFARLSSLAPVEGQHYASALFDPALAVVGTACRAATPCPKACRRLAASVQDGSLYEAVGDFPREELDDAGEAAYWQFEDRLATCAARLPLGPSQAVDAAALNAELAASELDLLVQVSPEAPTLAAALTDLDGALIDATEEAEDEVADAEAAGLSRYTAELEADEYGLRNFVRLGYRPEDWSEAEFALARAGEREAPLDEADWDSKTCERAWRADWKREGSVVVPPRGNLDDPHPYSCFRIWNAQRFAVSQHLMPASRGQPVALAKDKEWAAPPWTDLVRAVVSARVAGAASSARGHALR